ncbi:UDP-N-acetylglucosamine 1-carboxyvinyltransferase [Eubacteriales bacterium OttesenSCG-928-N13]|nr:UDP-N-acetylglucosamine 1-carboxyvinyltransferase [Eubacteriales bacterium OttesenSCG-928-N13]
MSEILCIQGGARLCGEVSVSGGKNAAVAIIPAALLANSPCTIENLPDIEDVRVLIEMLEYLGAEITFTDGTMCVDPTKVDKYKAPYELSRRMRASYYLAPVLLGLFSRAEVPLPGGCDIGARPIDQTIKGMTTLGADVRIERGSMVVSTDGMYGAEVYLDLPSVGATVNTVLTAVTARGNTTINNAAKEPHIVDLANFLNSMGARIKGAGTDVIRVAGGRELHGSTYAVIPDQIETGTLMIAAAATGGDVLITGAIPTHMEALSAKLLEMGVYVSDDDDRIHIRSDGNLRAVNVKTQVYPGFPTDLQQPITSLLTIANGSSMVTETIYEARFKYVEELRRLGASIRVIDHTAIVEGVDRLIGAPVTATDLRAGASMIIAGLIADGVTEVSGLNYILRGYEDIDRKLRSLGAKVERVVSDRVLMY